MNKLDIETMDHTLFFAHQLSELGGLKLPELAAGLYAVLHIQHDLVIRLHERLLSARREIAILKGESGGEK